MKWLRTLSNTQQGILPYVLKALGLSLGGAILAAIIVSLMLPSLEQHAIDGDIGWKTLFFGLVVFSPVVETLLMWPVIALLSLFLRHVWVIAVISALLWAALHSLQAPAWGLTIFWSFIIFSIAFIEWRKHSIGKALGVTMLIHGCQNLIAVGLVLLGA